MIPLTLVLFFKLALAIRDIFCFHMDFREINYDLELWFRIMIKNWTQDFEHATQVL